MGHSGGFVETGREGGRYRERDRETCKHHPSYRLLTFLNIPLPPLDRKLRSGARFQACSPTSQDPLVSKASIRCMRAAVIFPRGCAVAFGPASVPKHSWLYSLNTARQKQLLLGGESDGGCKRFLAAALLSPSQSFPIRAHASVQLVCAGQLSPNSRTRLPSVFLASIRKSSFDQNRIF